MLRIHKENLKMVTRLGTIGASQELLVPLAKGDKGGLNHMYRSKSAHTHRTKVGDTAVKSNAA